MALALTLVLVATSALARKVMVYEPQHRIAAELLPFAEMALGPEGSARVDPRTDAIVLIGDEAHVQQALALLREQDTPMRMIVIRSSQISNADLLAQGLRIEWQGSHGWIVIGADYAAKNPTVEMSLEPGLRVDWSEHAARHHHSFTTEVRVLEGSTARITRGTSVPYSVGGGTEYVSADSGMQTTARMTGNGKIHVDLRPFQAQPLQGGAIAHGSTASSVVLAPGEAVVIGGTDQDTRAQSGARLPSTAAQGATSLTIISATVETPTLD